MKHILMLATGGTIASRISVGGGLTPALSGQELLCFVPALQEVCRITVQDLLALDSTDVTAQDRLLMARQIWQARTQYDGFVVTHGTDTLAYTAALLTHLLPNFDKPVILTGSMYPIGTGGDAEGNLLDAFRVAACGVYAGAAVCVQGKILRGSHAVKLNSVTAAAFGSVGAPPDGSVAADGTVHIDHCPSCTGAPCLVDTLDTSAFVLHLTPDTSPTVFSYLQTYRSVIIEGFGTGGIPARLESALERLICAGTRVYITTQCPFGGADLTKYAVGCRARALGAVDLGTRTLEDSLAAILCGEL